MQKDLATNCPPEQEDLNYIEVRQVRNIASTLNVKLKSLAKQLSKEKDLKQRIDILKTLRSIRKAIHDLNELSMCLKHTSFRTTKNMQEYWNDCDTFEELDEYTD